jgi:hypothetical protein
MNISRGPARGTGTWQKNRPKHFAVSKLIITFAAGKEYNSFQKTWA